jgi:SAM-dependent methyltransferase
MNILKEIIKNQLIKIPFVRKRAQKSHSTGLNENPDEIKKVISFYKKYIDFSGKKVLELGPGQTFQVAEEITKMGANVIIADIDRYLDENMLKSKNIEYVIYDGSVLPFSDESFDIIISFTVYEHIRYPKTTVSDTFRVLKKGGELVHCIDLGDHFSYGVNEDLLFNCLQYSETIWNAMTWNRSTYVNRLRKTDWLKLHESAGFKIKSVDTEDSERIRSLYKEGKLAYLDRFSEEDKFCKTINIFCAK